MNWWLTWVENADGTCEQPLIVAAKFHNQVIPEMGPISEGQSIHVLNVAINIHEHRDGEPVEVWDYDKWVDTMDQHRRKFPDLY